ncbi:hypothetical protein TSOC_014329, partial [Tetrabaena socialis]
MARLLIGAWFRVVVWEAALAFAAEHGGHPGWRAAVQELRAQLQRAAAEEEGPLSVYGIGATCLAVAGAAALDAALQRPEGGGAQAQAAPPAGAPPPPSAGGVLPVLLAAAACISDAVRQQEGTTRRAQRWRQQQAGRAEELWQQLLALRGDLTPAPAGPAAGASGAASAGEREGVEEEGQAEDGPDGEEEAAGADAATVAAAAHATCLGAGRLLGPAGSLQVLEVRWIAAAGVPPLSGSPPATLTAGPPAGSREPTNRIRGAAVGGVAVRFPPLPLPLLPQLPRGSPTDTLLEKLNAQSGSPAGMPSASRAALLAAASAVAAGAAGRLQRVTGAAEPAVAAAPASVSASAAPAPAPDRVLIEELPAEPAAPAGAPSAERQAADEWRRQQHALACDLLHLCAAYAPPRPPHASATPQPADGPGGGPRPHAAAPVPAVSSAAAAAAATAAAAAAAPVPAAPAAAAAAADPGLPPPPRDLLTPWASPATAAACGALLAALCARARALPPRSRALGGPASSGAGSLALLSADEVAEQDLLLGCLPDLYGRLRGVVVQRHVQDLEQGPIQPYGGPDTFTRAVAARRLAWLLMRSRHPFVGEALGACLPGVLACCDDPAPGVAQYGIAMLHAAAVECLAADLQWQRELLLEQARRMVVGCHEQVWRLACPAALALVRRIEGKDPRAGGYHRLASELLTEAERQGHLPARRLPFLAALRHLAPCLGLTLCRHLTRLMPLLLEWLHAWDAASREAALAALAEVVRATWVRAPAHAEVLWRHMLLVLLPLPAAALTAGGKRARRSVHVGEAALAALAAA